MKTASKIFIILGMIVEFWLIIPLIVGILALSKINSATSKNDLTATGIFTILFCSVLGGIFMLCIPEEELAKNKAPQIEQPLNLPTPQQNRPLNDSELAAELEKINKLKQQGLITEEEYKTLRQRVIDKTFDK